MNLGLPEILIIFLLALLLFGPRKLPEIGRTVGKFMHEFRRASDELKTTIEREVNLEAGDLRPDLVKFKQQIAEARNELSDIRSAVDPYTAATPAGGAAAQTTTAEPAAAESPDAHDHLLEKAVAEHATAEMPPPGPGDDLKG
ncbi:MAG TPA: twin-arginine translocase TatA/TatE family subunit [Acidobacteriota bacterium]|nr:twin-arginine translocase TatA/TatE family subunit [Acidobacteriota bacterium]HQM62137.1 twin-arginine translocase TatA/TatE family subunit [Acidobacteriota bacterium]